MILRAGQAIDNVYLDRGHPSEFIEFVKNSVKRELINKLMDELEDHKIHIIELKEPAFMEDRPRIGESSVIQNLACEKLVQCKHCMMVYPWCQKFRDELGGNGFCPYGKEFEEEDE